MTKFKKDLLSKAVAKQQETKAVKVTKAVKKVKAVKETKAIKEPQEQKAKRSVNRPIEPIGRFETLISQDGYTTFKYKVDDLNGFEKVEYLGLSQKVFENKDLVNDLNTYELSISLARQAIRYMNGLTGFDLAVQEQQDVAMEIYTEILENAQELQAIEEYEEFRQALRRLKNRAYKRFTRNTLETLGQGQDDYNFEMKAFRELETKASDALIDKVTTIQEFLEIRKVLTIKQSALFAKQLSDDPHFTLSQNETRMTSTIGNRIVSKLSVEEIQDMYSMLQGLMTVSTFRYIYID